MGIQKWVSVVSDASLRKRPGLILDYRVISLGYEEEFKQYRRIVQHALSVLNLVYPDKHLLTISQQLHILSIFGGLFVPCFHDQRGWEADRETSKLGPKRSSLP